MSNLITIGTQPKTLTFEQFLEWYPEDGRCELIDGKIFEMQPTGQHEDVTEFLVENLTNLSRKLQGLYHFPRRALVKAPSW